MCGNLFKSPKPKVERVAPAPTAIQSNETAAIGDRVSEENRRRRARVGADQMRSVLTDTAQGGRQTLG